MTLYKCREIASSLYKHPVPTGYKFCCFENMIKLFSSYFYNMMACVGHFIDGCQEFDDVIPVNQSLEAVVQLVGARCGQLGTTGQPGSCNNSIPTCDIMKALEECGTDTGSVCL